VKAIALAVLAACGTPQEIKDVVYDPTVASSKLDFYLPDADGKAHALVLFIHGGSWSGGDKSHFRFAGPRLARSGYAVASIDYRLVPDGVFPNNIHDCLCSLAFLRAHAAEFDIDPARIVVMGYSAGAHLASLVGIASDDPALAPPCTNGQPIPRPAGVIPASGPQDMRVFWNRTHSVTESIFGGSPDELPDAYSLGSPVDHVAPGAPPYLLMEDLVDDGGVEEMRADLLAAGNQATLLKVAGSLHVFEQEDEAGEYEFEMASETPEAWLAIDHFLQTTVGAP
jgi:acetyl esterase/lipase